MVSTVVPPICDPSVERLPLFCDRFSVHGWILRVKLPLTGDSPSNATCDRPARAQKSCRTPLWTTAGMFAQTAECRSVVFIDWSNDRPTTLRPYDRRPIIPFGSLLGQTRNYGGGRGQSVDSSAGHLRLHKFREARQQASEEWIIIVPPSTHR